MKDIEDLSSRYQQETTRSSEETDQMVRTMKTDYERRLAQETEKVMILGKTVEDLRMKTVLQDSYWRKREEKLNQELKQQVRKSIVR